MKSQTFYIGVVLLVIGFCFAFSAIICVGYLQFELTYLFSGLAGVFVLLASGVLYSARND